MRLALIAACLAFPVGVAANPTGGTVTSGSATMSTSGSTLTVTTSATGTVINWTAFSIGAGETTRFNQPSSASITLNRVTGPSQSSIMGSLQSNGQVFLANPNGIVIGPSAQVNVAGFVASTLDISDSNFLSGNLQFAGTTGSVVNNGSITATDYVALIGHDVHTTGSISSGSGGVAIGAGNSVGLGGSSLNVGPNVADAHIGLEGGTITASGPVNIISAGSITFAGTTINAPAVNIDIASGAGGGGGVFGVVCGSGGCGAIPLPPAPILITSPNVTLATTTAATGSLSVGAVVIATGNFTAANSGGAVVLQGTQVAPATSLVAPTSVKFNLEKREVSF